MIRATMFSIISATAILSTSVASATPSSGLLLGIYAYPGWYGMRVINTIPGYSAEGRLFRNDELLRLTVDGFTFYPAQSHWQMEHAKNAIGPGVQAALEIYRPGWGKQYLWVEFIPVGGPVMYSQQGAGGQMPLKAKILTEKEKPGAAALFNKPNIGVPPNFGGTPPINPPLNNSAASLFGR